LLFELHAKLGLFGLAYPSLFLFARRTFCGEPGLLFGGEPGFLFFASAFRFRLGASASLFGRLDSRLFFRRNALFLNRV